MKRLLMCATIWILSCPALAQDVSGDDCALTDHGPVCKVPGPNGPATVTLYVCKGHDHIGDLEANVWAGYGGWWPSDPLQVALGYWAFDGRCLGYPDSCTASCADGTGDVFGVLSDFDGWRWIDLIDRIDLPYQTESLWLCRAWAVRYPPLPGDLYGWIKGRPFWYAEGDWLGATLDGYHRIEEGSVDGTIYTWQKYHVKIPTLEHTQCCEIEVLGDDCEWTEP